MSPIVHHGGKLLHLEVQSGGSSSWIFDTAALLPSYESISLGSGCSPLQQNSVLLVPAILTGDECDRLIASCDTLIASNRASGGVEGTLRGEDGDEEALHRTRVSTMDAESKDLVERMLLLVFAFLERELPEVTRNLFGHRALCETEIMFAPAEPAISRYTAGGELYPHQDEHTLTVLVPLSNQGPAAAPSADGSGECAEGDESACGAFIGGQVSSGLEPASHPRACALGIPTRELSCRRASTLPITKYCRRSHHVRLSSSKGHRLLACGLQEARPLRRDERRAAHDAHAPPRHCDPLRGGGDTRRAPRHKRRAPRGRLQLYAVGGHAAGGGGVRAPGRLGGGEAPRPEGAAEASPMAWPAERIYWRAGGERGGRALTRPANMCD